MGVLPTQLGLKPQSQLDRKARIRAFCGEIAHFNDGFDPCLTAETQLLAQSKLSGPSRAGVKASDSPLCPPAHPGTEDAIDACERDRGL